MLNYKGLEAVFEHVTVTEDQVDRQIDRLIDQSQKAVVTTDRPSQLGDEVVLDYTGFCDGEAFEGGHAEDYPLTLGSGTFIPGFEDQLVGKTAGEHVDVHVTFPVMYPAAHMAGKNATFRCKIKEIRAYRKYAADDTFAREIAGCESFAQFKQQLWESMQAYINRQSDLELRGRLLDQLCDQFECDITDEQLEKALDIEMSELEAQLTQQKLTLDLYCQFMSKSREELREEFIPSAQKNIKRQMIIAEIARIENIEADEQSIADAFYALCREHSIAPEELQMHFDDQLQTILTRTVIENKVLDVIKSNATITTIER